MKYKVSLNITKILGGYYYDSNNCKITKELYRRKMD